MGDWEGKVGEESMMSWGQMGKVGGRRRVGNEMRCWLGVGWGGELGRGRDWKLGWGVGK